MGNIVIVTRAPRLKLIVWDDMPDQSLYVNNVGHASVKTIGGRSVSIEHRIANVLTDWMWHKDLFYVFPDFETLAKWVCGGRKLEDLQGDSKSEWVPFSSLGYNDLFEIPGGGNGLFMKLGHCYEFCRITYRMTKIGSPDDCRFDDSSALVWPVRFDLGDTITITAG
jgi:hypothetical protein